MTQQETLEYNKRCMKILEMEYEIHSNTYRYKDLITTTLQFHSDWNWIHEIVEAIEKLGYTVAIWDNVCVIPHLKKCISETKKEAVIHAINQFLIWYNENKTNQ